MRPPAGIAMAAVLICGYRIWPGILIGGLCMAMPGYFESLADNSAPSDAITLSMLAIGSAVLQALVGAAIVKQFRAYPSAYESFPRIMILLIAGIISSTISPTFSLLGIDYLSNESESLFLFNWLVWWVGDCTGILLFTPALLLLFGKSTKEQTAWRKRIVVIASLVLMAFCASMIYFVKQNYEKELNNEFEKTHLSNLRRSGRM